MIMASIVVEQFVELLAGSRKVGVNEFRTVRVRVEEGYCLGCFGVHAQDVWEGVKKAHVIRFGELEVGFQVRRCQNCGKESVV